MKIVLIFPNYLLRKEFGETLDPPLGIAAIAAVFEKRSYDVSIIDANVENLTIDEIRSRLIKLKPDVVGISCNYSPLHNPTLGIAAMVKSEFDIPVIVGGNHATAVAEYMLSCSHDIDFIARSEGEAVLPDLLEALQQKALLNHVKGITYREGDSIISTPHAPLIANLDDLPIPAYHFYPWINPIQYNCKQRVSL